MKVTAPLAVLPAILAGNADAEMICVHDAR